jgi:hypothetical protein
MKQTGDYTKYSGVNGLNGIIASLRSLIDQIHLVSYWILKECDINKDIKITHKMQLTLPDIQLKYAGRVFRAYVKLMANGAFCRCEESLKVDFSIVDAFNHIQNPNRVLERKVDELIHLVRRLGCTVQDEDNGGGGKICE